MIAIRNVVLTLVVWLVACISISAFTITRQPTTTIRNSSLGTYFRGLHSKKNPIILNADATEESTSLLEEIRLMRVKQLKEELGTLGISTQDVFEKEDLVKRLYQARQNGQQKSSSSSNETSTTSKGEKIYETPSNDQNKNNGLQAPLYFTSLDSGTRVAAINGADITVEASDHPYPSIKIEVIPSSGAAFTLNLLLDTACSGLVLRPSVVEKYNLPSLSTPVTMTGAGGTSSNTGLTQLECFRLETQTFGPLPAAVQDIGALPSSLDGIIGLSFLNQFEGFDMDFRKGKLFLYAKGKSIPNVPSNLEIVAEGSVSLVPRLSIYVVDVFIGGRGPVKMLVDSGASDTFLNWKGISDLSLSRDSKFLNRLPAPMGAVGSDAVAMRLTHRINISSSLNLGNARKPGLSLKDSKRWSIDIGDIAILEAMRGDGVAGILGIDAFMRCDAVRMTFHGRDPSIQFLLNKEDTEVSAS